MSEPEPLPDDPAASDSDREFMRRAYDLARSAVDHGSRPFGSLLVKDEKVIAEVENEVATTKDPTRHAELGLVSLVSRTFDDDMLSSSTLYTSTEPCLMCCGAIYSARIGTVVFGTTASRLDELLGADYRGIPAREVFGRIAPNVKIIGPVMEAEGIAIHRDFWPIHGDVRRGRPS